MKKSLLLPAVALIISGFAQAAAQTPTRMGPPAVLYISREDIKPGKMPAHTKESEAYARILAKENGPYYRLALVPVAGNENEVIYLNAEPSFAQLEATLNGRDKKETGATGAMKAVLDRQERESSDLHAAMRDLMAVYREDLSFEPNVDVRQMRYFAITTVRVRPGHDAEFVDYVKSILNPARAMAKAPLHTAVYQVIAGAPAGTYMSFRPLKSLSEYDANVLAMARNAMSEDERKNGDRAVSDAFISLETSVYAFNPRMSYVEKEFAAGDPAFWNPKPEKMAVAKRRVKKSGPKVFSRARG